MVGGCGERGGPACVLLAFRHLVAFGVHRDTLLGLSKHVPEGSLVWLACAAVVGKLRELHQPSRTSDKMDDPVASNSSRKQAARQQVSALYYGRESTILIVGWPFRCTPIKPGRWWSTGESRACRLVVFAGTDQRTLSSMPVGLGSSFRAA
jgi:hypothetical protein